jgi:hypothetical protein
MTGSKVVVPAFSFIVLLIFAVPLYAADKPLDAESGMVIDENWQLVKAHCTVCHSAKLLTQQRGSRETWLHLIRWMQDTQGLWQFDEITQSSILDYLELNYAPSAVSRRNPLAPSLMPPRPLPDNS